MFYAYFKLISEKSINYHIILDNLGYIKDLSYLASIFLDVNKDQLKSEEIKLEEILNIENIPSLADE